MNNYRVVIDPRKCCDCGISIGRCPKHAQLLGLVLKPNSKQTKHHWISMGIFNEESYDYVKKLVSLCPEHALVIEKVENISK